MTEKENQILEVVIKVDELLQSNEVDVSIALDALSLISAHLAVLLSIEKAKYLEGTEAMFDFQLSKKLEQSATEL